MNLALPAALLLALALPGFIFVYAYTGTLRSRRDPIVSNESVTMGWIFGLMAAVAAHAIWVPLTNKAVRLAGYSYEADPDSVLYLLAGEYREGFAEHIRSFTAHPYSVLLYFASLYIVAALLGTLAHKIVLQRRWDRKFGLLRFNNEWHYLFYGDAEVDGVLITVTCNHADSTSLYAGVLETFDFTGAGQLDRIVLISAARAQLPAAGGSPATFERIQGDKFVIWCRDVNTLNVAYLRIKSAAPAPAASSAAR